MYIHVACDCGGDLEPVDRSYDRRTLICTQCPTEYVVSITRAWEMNKWDRTAPFAQLVVDVMDADGYPTRKVPD